MTTAKSKGRGTRTNERDRDTKAIRDVEHWLWHGNSARVPGGRFARIIDLLNAVSRVTMLAKEAMKSRPARKPGRNTR
jgi:hypothetical protein